MKGSPPARSPPPEAHDDREDEPRPRAASDSQKAEKSSKSTRNGVANASPSSRQSRHASPPPLPAEPPPDDGWEPLWDEGAQAYYFYNRFTKVSQWDNPRVPDASQHGLGNHDRIEAAPGTTGENGAQQEKSVSRPHGGYDPAIHGDYDPAAPYAQQARTAETDGHQVAPDAAALYAQSGAFNRWTGKWQSDELNPENHNDENKSRRQMSAFFDVDAAANSHDGRSLKAERAGKKLSKQELKAFKEKRKEKKEEKRRAWLRD